MNKNQIIAGLDGFTRQFLATALWSETDNKTPQGGDPLENNYSLTDFALDTLKRLIADCKRFQKGNAADLEAGCQANARCNEGQAGHDFWLTRDHHGAGFWDGDWPKDIGERLTAASDKFGEVHLYVHRGLVRAD